MQNDFFSGRKDTMRRRRSSRRIRRRLRPSQFRGFNTSYGTAPPNNFGLALPEIGAMNLQMVTKLKNYLPLFLMVSGIKLPAWMIPAAGIMLKSDALYGYGIGMLVKEKFPQISSGGNQRPNVAGNQQNPVLAMLNRANQFHGYNVNDFAGMGPSAVDLFSGSANEFKV